MEETTEHWLAHLIEAHHDELTALLADNAIQDMPMYAALPREAVIGVMGLFCRKLAETVHDSDVDIMRAYLEPAALARLRAGFPVQGYLRLADIFENYVNKLIAREWTGSPTQATSASRHLRAMLNQVRMLFSKINMRILTNPDQFSPGT